MHGGDGGAPGQADDANVIINPGLGTVDELGVVIEERMRLAVRALFAQWAAAALGRSRWAKANMPDIFDKRGLRRVINVSGTETPFGAVPVRPK